MYFINLGTLKPNKCIVSSCKFSSLSSRFYLSLKSLKDMKHCSRYDTSQWVFLPGYTGVITSLSFHCICLSCTGLSISEGEKQKILIMKNVFLDETADWSLLFVQDKSHFPMLVYTSYICSQNCSYNLNMCNFNLINYRHR